MHCLHFLYIWYNLKVHHHDTNRKMGRLFTATILTDDGGFELRNIEIGESLALFTANGFYFSEQYGELLYAPIALQAMPDLSGTTLVNINIMTHLVKERIMKFSDTLHS
jgi:hypothetical protein